jgi:hypothetical protein
MKNKENEIFFGVSEFLYIILFLIILFFIGVFIEFLFPKYNKDISTDQLLIQVLLQLSTTVIVIHVVNIGLKKIYSNFDNIFNNKLLSPGKVLPTISLGLYFFLMQHNFEKKIALIANRIENSVYNF